LLIGGIDIQEPDQNSVEQLIDELRISLELIIAKGANLH